MYEEANPFIGHKSEKDTFRKFLNEENPQGPSVLFFHEEPDGSMPKGGIGKSWVLRECTREVARHDDLKMVGVDFFSIQDRDGLVIARRIVDALKQLFTDWNPDQFETLFERYQQTQQAGQKNRQMGHLIELRRQLHTVLRQELDMLQQRLGSNRKRLFVFCDTYERVERYPNALSLLPTRHFLETYHIPAIAFVMAGRNELDWKSMYWHNYRQHVQPVIVPPFTPKEIIEYLEEHLMLAEREQDEVLTEVATLHRLTQGRPILVGLLVDLLNDHGVQFEQVLEVKQSEFERYLVEKIHAGRDPGSWAVLLMAHIHHRFNQHMLDWLFSHLKFRSEAALPATIEKAWKKLQGYSFVRLSVTTNDIALHDEMRRMVVEHIWKQEDKPKGISRQELSESIIEYYDHAIAAEENALLRQSYEIEQLYHKLYLDPVGNFALFREQMESALQLKQNNRARPLFQEMQELVALFSEEQRYQMEEFEARLLQNEEDFEGALSIYKRLLDSSEKPWIRERQGELLQAQGMCYTNTNQFPDAIYTLTRALEIFQARDDIIPVGVTLSRIGYAYMKQGELDTAIKFYQESIEIAREQEDLLSYADGLTSLAHVRRLQSNLTPALRDVRSALLIREELHKEKKISDLALAYSLTGIGNIYYAQGNIHEAQKFYERAYNMYEQNFNQSGLAWTSNHFGLLALHYGNLQEAEEWFQKAYEIGHDSHKESATESLRWQSRMWYSRNQYERAISLLQRAIELVKAIGQHRQQAEWQVELVEMLRQTDRTEEAMPLLEEAEALATRYHYYKLLGQIARIRGDHAYEVGDYRVAFHFYTNFCYYMMLYNTSEYTNAVQEIIIKRMYEIPDTVIRRRIWQQVHDAWTGLYLEEEASVMMQTLEEVKLLLNL